MTDAQEMAVNWLDDLARRRSANAGPDLAQQVREGLVRAAAICQAIREAGAALPPDARAVHWRAMGLDLQRISLALLELAHQAEVELLELEEAEPAAPLLPGGRA